MGSEGKKAVRLWVARCRFSIFHDHFVAPSENIFFLHVNAISVEVTDCTNAGFRYF